MAAYKQREFLKIKAHRDEDPLGDYAALQAVVDSTVPEPNFNPTAKIHVLVGIDADGVHQIEEEEIPDTNAINPTILAARIVAGQAFCDIVNKSDGINAPDIAGLTGSQIFNAITDVDRRALSAAERETLRDIYMLGETVDVGSGTETEAALARMFPSGKASRINLDDLTIGFKQSICKSLGLRPCSPSLASRLF